ncbi:MAG: response regulator transcription factor [Prolixibacteraceae bacterium]|jgi:two-component system LytT family response regulator
MGCAEKIQVAIVDDNKAYLESLVEHLSFFPEIEICGSATQYKQARELLVNEKPDLVFLDIEMPCKNGFELLNEVRKKGSTFSVIFYTAYDKYMIHALRESAFDYILKPVKEDELRQAIDRFKKQREEQSKDNLVPLYQGTMGSPEVVALPSNLGLRFIDKNRILLFRCINSGILEKSSWEVLLTDYATIKLGAKTTADRIIQLMNKDRFLQINQSCIINLNYLSMVEFKTRNCLLMPPFDNLDLTVSRTHLSKLRESFEVF